MILLKARYNNSKKILAYEIAWIMLVAPMRDV